MKKYFLISLTLLFSIPFQSCRYEEGPFISFRFRTMRMRGNWTIQSFTANGADSMNYIRRFNFDGTWGLDEQNSTPFFSIYKDSIGIAAGDYHSNYHQRIHFVPWNNHGVPGDWILKTEWKVIKLKTGDMKWRAKHEEIEYVLHFKN